MFPQVSPMLPMWGWAAVMLVPPAIFLLYFLKLKRRPIEVPSTYLWRKSIEDLHVNSLLQRLKQNILLILQLLAIFLAILALLGFSWQGDALVGERFVFLIDNSASMNAEDLDNSRFEAAKQQVRDYIDAMPGGSAAMLISFSDGAKVVQGFTSNRAELRRRLERIEPSAHTTSIQEAVQAAAGLANPGSSEYGQRVAEVRPASLYIFSDGNFAPPDDFFLGNLSPVFIAMGKDDTENVAIVDFNARRKESDPDTVEAFCRLYHFGTRPIAQRADEQVSCIVELFLDGQQIDAKQVDIPLNDSTSLAFTLLSPQGGVLETRVKFDDPLPIDNKAWAAVNPPRPGKVLVVTPGNTPLTNVLTTGRSQPLSQVLFRTPDYLESEEYDIEARGGIYNLIIYDRCVPEQMPFAHTMFLGRLPPSRWETDTKQKGINPQIIDINRAHPLTNLVELGDVHIVQTLPKIKGPPGTRVLVDSDDGPLIAVAPREGFQDVVLGFEIISADGWNTDWPIRPSFAVFMLNVVQTLSGGTDPLVSTSVRPGETVTLRNQLGEENVVVTTPSGKEITVPRGLGNAYQFIDTEELGIYTARWSEDEVQRFAVNLFDPAESNIPAASKLTFGPEEVEQTGSNREVAKQEAWKFFLLLALAALAAEWYFYNRRVHM